MAGRTDVAEASAGMAALTLQRHGVPTQGAQRSLGQQPHEQRSPLETGGIKRGANPEPEKLEEFHQLSHQCHVSAEQSP
jgi:hypothetical protein